MSDNNNPHKNHRQRMHARVRQYGLASLADHEILEYLLYFTNAQKDTNPLAHALIDAFGDLAGVLEASEEELMEVKGIGPSSARLLHLLPEAAACYERSRARDWRNLNSTERLGRYVLAQFQRRTREQALLLGLNQYGRLRRTVWLSGEGSLDRVELEVQTVVTEAVRLDSPVVVLAHNHPSGNVLPSRADIEATARIMRGLTTVGILLKDHIIVAEKSFSSMRADGRLPQGPEYEPPLRRRG